MASTHQSHGDYKPSVAQKIDFSSVTMVSTPESAGRYFLRLEKELEWFKADLLSLKDRLTKADFFPPPIVVFDNGINNPDDDSEIKAKYMDWKAEQPFLEEWKSITFSYQINDQIYKLEDRRQFNIFDSPLFELVMNNLEAFDPKHIVDQIKKSFQILTPEDYYGTVLQLVHDSISDEINGCETLVLKDPLNNGNSDAFLDPFSSSDSFLFNMVDTITREFKVDLQMGHGMYGYLQYISNCMEGYKFNNIGDLLCHLEENNMITIRVVEDAFYTGDQKSNLLGRHKQLIAWLASDYPELDLKLKKGDPKLLSDFFNNHTKVYVVGSTNIGFEKVDRGRGQTHVQRYLQTIEESIDDISQMFLLHMLSVTGDNDDSPEYYSSQRANGIDALYGALVALTRSLACGAFKFPDEFSVPAVWQTPFFFPAGQRLYFDANDVPKIFEDYKKSCEQSHPKKWPDPTKHLGGSDNKNFYTEVKEWVDNRLGYPHLDN